MIFYPSSSPPFLHSKHVVVKRMNFFFFFSVTYQHVRWSPSNPHWLVNTKSRVVFGKKKVFLSLFSHNDVYNDHMKKKKKKKKDDTSALAQYGEMKLQQEGRACTGYDIKAGSFCMLMALIWLPLRVRDALFSAASGVAWKKQLFHHLVCRKNNHHQFG